MNDILIIGAGGFGREVEMLVYQINKIKPQWNFIGYLDDSIPEGVKVGNSQVIGSTEAIENFENTYFVIAIANAKIKRKILGKVPNKVKPARLLHPSIICGERVQIGEGSIICAGNIITEDIIIGSHVILNLSCTVGHDTIIMDYCSFMPSVNISGEVKIEEGVFVGTGAKIINQVEIGRYSIIGAGAVVSKTIPSNCTAVGIPAKPIKFHDSI
jgi:sugar O-acyltransferase (sialic acid O-acetyltransferase NeuD family)